nr:DUF4372 domain-containing protein [uncultured Prevotella sp.]
MNRTQFNNYVRKYDGNRYVKHFTCWNQLLAMMFGHLPSERDTHPSPLYWLIHSSALLRKTPCEG